MIEDEIDDNIWNMTDLKHYINIDRCPKCRYKVLLIIDLYPQSIIRNSPCPWNKEAISHVGKLFCGKCGHMFLGETWYNNLESALKFNEKLIEQIKDYQWKGKLFGENR